MRVTKPNPKQTDSLATHVRYTRYSKSALSSALFRAFAPPVLTQLLQMRGYLLDFCPREERRRVQPVVESVANVAVDDEPHREVDEGEHAEGGEDDLHGGR